MSVLVLLMLCACATCFASILCLCGALRVPLTPCHMTRAISTPADAACSSSVHQVVLHVYKCRYCVNQGDSLRAIASRFDAHWSLLWSLNHAVMHSARIVSAARRLLQLGDARLASRSRKQRMLIHAARF